MSELSDLHQKNGYEANYDKLHDTRSLEDVGPGSQLDTEKNKEKITTADVKVQ
jgi:hypothetical protein